MSWLSNVGHDIGQFIGSEDKPTVAGLTNPNTVNYEEELKKMQYEDALQARKDASMLRPIELEALGYKQLPDGTLEKIPVVQDELSKLYYENAIKAAKGELPVSPALEADLTQQKNALAENLSRRLGSNWQTSTPGIQSLSEFDKRAGLLREEARRGQMTTGESLLSSRMGYLTDQNQQNYNQTQNWNLPRYQVSSGMYSNAMQPYQFNREMQYQSDYNNKMIKSQDRAGMMGLLGQGVGTVGTLAMLSSKDAKTDIKKASKTDEAGILDMMKKTDVHSWKYKGDSKSRVGMLTENAPMPMVTEDGKHLDVPTYMGFLHASVKSLAKKIDKMEGRG